MNTGKVAIITGANHGTGAAIAKELAFTGYNVVITWLNPTKYAFSHIDQARMFHTMGGGDGADGFLREITENNGKAVSFPRTWRTKTISLPCWTLHEENSDRSTRWSTTPSTQRAMTH